LQENPGSAHEPLGELELRAYLIDRLLFYQYMIGDPERLMTATPAQMTEEIRSEVRKNLSIYSTADMESILTDLLWEHRQVDTPPPTVPPPYIHTSKH